MMAIQQNALEILLEYAPEDARNRVIAMIADSNAREKAADAYSMYDGDAL